ncbi:hypothetical protein C4577_06240 [Candidatus Parcubacteria bacterium]|nr:MAG: hypothetical protein C4577_06240 [Candidatus Parcubacteria bacterium]
MQYSKIIQNSNLKTQNFKVKVKTLNLLIVVLTFAFLFLSSPVYAVVDPLTTTNNKFGIHIISPTIDESSPAASLVNSNGGDWGYITVLIESKDRNHDKWQTFFNDLRRRHLIPLVRLATEPDGSYWKRPYEGEETAWADFLDRLVWPIKNRYVIIYNEPNQGQEWAGQVDPRSYAQVLDKTVTALKNKNEDFFVLNAGFDASAPNKPPLFLDQVIFMQEMNKEVPGIFNKLDGWVSHSYPNPGFAGSPYAIGRGTIQTWRWELDILRRLGVNKQLPIFITETGWKHAEGIDFDKSLPGAEAIGDYFQYAFNDIWDDSQIVAVTPFLLDYQQPPFDHFSFKRPTGKIQNQKILGITFPEYYPHYQKLAALSKYKGQPRQNNQAELAQGSIYSSLVLGEGYVIPLTFKNTGQSIWNDELSVELRAIEGQTELGIEPVRIEGKIEPGQEAVFELKLKGSQAGHYNLKLQMFINDKTFDQTPLEYTIEVKSPVILQVKSSLTWKKKFNGEYSLGIDSDVIKITVPTQLNLLGQSTPFEARYLLPDHEFSFTLSRPFYKPKTITQKTVSGLNQLDFGKLEPDILPAIINPIQLWRLLPFSN